MTTQKWAYYNEFDPFAAAWLRELMKDGLIAPGEVDERSIEDVTPDELRSFRQCHFFAGIGVWSLALRICGVPDDAPIWTGSCPCQPFSAAGKGEGFADERHLWPAFHFLIEQCGPELVAGEQVAGADGDAWLDLVQADLDATGYAFGATETVAAGFGAPHKRSRNYWLAYAQNSDGRSGERGTQERTWASEFWRRLFASRGFVDGMAAVGLADSERAGLEGFRGDGRDGDEPGRIGTDAARSASEGGESSVLANHELQQRQGRQRGIGDVDDTRGWEQSAAETSGLRGSLGLADLHGDGRDQGRGSITEAGHDGIIGNSPFGLRRNSRPGPVNGFWHDADWLRCRDERWRAIESSPLALADAGTIREFLAGGGRASEAFTFPLSEAGAFKNRVGLLKGAGNAITIGQAVGFLQAAFASIYNGAGGIFRPLKYCHTEYFSVMMIEPQGTAFPPAMKTEATKE